MVIAAVMVTIGIIITIITILQNLFCYGKVFTFKTVVGKCLQEAADRQLVEIFLVKKILYF